MRRRTAGLSRRRRCSGRSAGPRRRLSRSSGVLACARGVFMLTELANIREHWTRYRDVTLKHLDLLSEEEMLWRPQPELFTCGQHVIHILGTEQYYFHGLFH